MATTPQVVDGLTPGPWFAGPVLPGSSQHGVGLDLSADLLPADPNDAVPVVRGTRPVGDDRDGYMSVTGICTLADATLMAASPEMLAALVAAETLFHHTFAQDGTVHKQMRAAIAKARGVAA